MRQQQVAACLCFVVLSAGGTLVIQASTRHHEVRYNPLVAILIQELVKFCVCAVAWVVSKEGTVRLDRRELALYAVPAAFFAVQDTLHIYAIAWLGSVTFQILASLQILWTALFSRFLLDRFYRTQQWAGLALLCAAAAIAGYSKAEQDPGNDLGRGITAVLVLTAMSGFAGVLSEKLLKSKTTEASIWVRNMQLYGWGILFMGIVVLAECPKEPLAGFNAAVWVFIFLWAGAGLSIAFIMLHLSAVIKNFAAVAALLLVLAVTFTLGTPVSPLVLLAAAVYAAAIALFARPQQYEPIVDTV